MEIIQKTLHNGIAPSEYSRIPHMIDLADFDTNHPNPNRIDRIASEINEYLKRKCKHIDRRRIGD